ncbi:MAG: hypothetical protein N4A43_04030 [Alphaproteobacteria bacterium]|jgi:hypothetical protein|nr:hypothetical protein [Alphaproteobacteria bacterium]
MKYKIERLSDFVNDANYEILANHQKLEIKLILQELIGLVDFYKIKFFFYKVVLKTGLYLN